MRENHYRTTLWYIHFNPRQDCPGIVIFLTKVTYALLTKMFPFEKMNTEKKAHWGCLLFLHGIRSWNSSFFFLVWIFFLTHSSLWTISTESDCYCWCCCRWYLIFETESQLAASTSLELPVCLMLAQPSKCRNYTPGSGWLFQLTFPTQNKFIQKKSDWHLL